MKQCLNPECGKTWGVTKKRCGIYKKRQLVVGSGCGRTAFPPSKNVETGRTKPHKDVLAAHCARGVVPNDFKEITSTACKKVRVGG